MPINFPTTSTVGFTYTYNSMLWTWNGYAWDKVTGSGVTGNTGATGPQGNTGATGPVGDYVISFNGLTGAVTGVTTSIANIFTALNTFNAGISAYGATFGNGPVTIAGYTAWHAGNDGATSALDAGLLYGVPGNIFASSLSTGLLYGGLLSINAGNTATFDITAGSGYIVTTGATFTAEPNPVVTRVNWTAKTGVTLSGLSSQDTTWVYVDSTGTVHQQATFFTDDQVQSTIALGALVHPSRSYISLARTIPNVSYATDKQYEQFIRAFGPMKVSGHTIQANDGNLRLNRTSGTAFILGRNYSNDPNNPSVVSDIAKTDAEIWRYYRGITAGSFVTVTGITTGIDPTRYDNGTGTLATVSPSTPFTIQRVFFFPNTPNVLGVYYGRSQYASLSEAANNIHLEDFTEITNTATNAVLAAFIIVKYNVTNLDTAIAGNDARIIQAGQFRTTSSGGGSVATNLDSLSDVVITGVQDDDVLIYDTTTSQWLNTPLAHIGVTRFNGLTGAVTGVGSFNGSTGAVVFSNYVSSFNGSTGTISGVNSVNGLTGVLTVFGGTGISVQAGGKGITLINTGVSSVNGLTGAVTLTSVSTGTVNTFTAIQQFNAGITSAGATFNGPVQVNGALTTTNGNVYHNIASNTFTVQTVGAINLGDSEITNNSVYISIDDTANSIYLSGPVTTTGTLSFGTIGAAFQTFTATTTSTTANQIIGNVAADSFRSVEFYVQAEDTDGLKYESLKIMVVHDGTNTFNTQYGLIRTSTSLGTYTTTLGAAGNSQLRLRVTPTSANTTVFKVTALAIPLT